MYPDNIHMVQHMGHAYSAYTYYRVVLTIPGLQAFGPKANHKKQDTITIQCSYWENHGPDCARPFPI